MNKIDLCVLAVVAVFGLLGALSGAARQIAHWVALGLAFVGSRPLAARLAPFAPDFGLPPALANAALTAVCFTAVSVLGGFLLGMALRRVIGSVSGSKSDRLGGLALGAAKGAAGAFAALAVVLVFEKPLAARLGPSAAPLKDSAAAGFVRTHNPLESAPPPALAKLRELVDGAGDPKAAAALASDPKFKALLEDPALKAALGNKALTDALKSGDLSALRKVLGR